MSTVVPTQFFAPLLQEIIDRITAEDGYLYYKDEVFGGREILAQRAAPYAKNKKDSVCRRIYHILHGTYKSTNVEVVDALLLGANIRLGSTDLPVMPDCITSAREMVEIWHELRGESISEEGSEALAWKLLHFSWGLTGTVRTRNVDHRTRAVLAA